MPAKHFYNQKFIEQERTIFKSIPVSGGTLSVVCPFLGVREVKEKIDVNQVIDLYITGYIPSEIAIIVSYHVETVREVIRDYKNSIGEENSAKIQEVHREYRRNRTGEARSFNKRLIRKHMSTRVAVNKNQSGYKLNNNKSALVYKREVGAKPCDLPSVYR